uniref:NADH-ubiquinone oxidoreductase chain 2 n=1 Tax=Nemotelus notatus TaxID=2719078 RepID=A0A7D7AI20_9DIPT|nr:NADH dehydrogenase subunit 2 [Nemotelus notatus]
MFNNISKLMFLSALMSGTLITISSTSWFGAWMGLEINLLSFIPLMNNSNNLMSTESALKYFLTQAIASSIFFVAIVLSMLKFNSWIENNMYNNMLITISLLIKSGSAPFHFWFPSVMEGLSWTNSLILMVWQKIAPLIMIYNVYWLNMMIVFIISSAFIGGIGGLSQTSIRKLMAFSSINHLSWMLMAMSESVKSWMLYFLLYALLTTSVVYFFNQNKLFHMNQLFIMLSTSLMMKFCFLVNFLSLGGLPPFTGFFPKWIVIQQLSFMNQNMMMFILILSSLITLYFYLRLCYAAFMIGSVEMNWNQPMHQNNKSYLYSTSSTFFSIAGLPMITLIYLFI